jgi:hypothetical protein
MSSNLPPHKLKDKNPAAIRGMELRGIVFLSFIILNTFEID